MGAGKSFVAAHLERYMSDARHIDLDRISHYILSDSPEPAYRALLQAHAGLGSQGQVAATYQRCQEALQRELGVTPSPETERLYEQLRRRELDRVFDDMVELFLRGIARSA